MTTPQVTNVFSSKSDVAYHELRRMILSGELPAGSRLAQYVLADKLQMSITPLREAIRRLSSEGPDRTRQPQRRPGLHDQRPRSTPALRGPTGPRSRRGRVGGRAAHRRRHRTHAHHRRATTPGHPQVGRRRAHRAQRLPPSPLPGLTQRRPDQDARRSLGQDPTATAASAWSYPPAKNPAPSTSTSITRSSNSSSPKTPPAPAI